MPGVNQYDQQDVLIDFWVKIRSCSSESGYFFTHVNFKKFHFPSADFS